MTGMISASIANLLLNYTLIGGCLDSPIAERSSNGWITADLSANGATPYQPSAKRWEWVQVVNLRAESPSHTSIDRAFSPLIYQTSPDLALRARLIYRRAVGA
jgi:hypothetical protein